MSYKILVTDLDGTLFNKKGQISDEDKNAVRSLSPKGFYYAFASGRVIDACLPLVDLLSVNAPCVLFDGALVYDFKTKTMVHQWPLDAELVKELVDYTRSHNIYLELFSKEVFFAEKPNWSDEIHIKFFNSHPHIVNFDDIVETHQIMKAELLTHNTDEEDEVKKLMSDFDNKCRFSLATSPSFPKVHFHNILDNNASKGNAILKLADYLNISISDLVAAGDGFNDLTMLQKAGFAVAMGNAYSELKDIADYVTDSVDNSGISKVINKFFLYK